MSQTNNTRMEKSVDDETSDESEPAKDEKTYGYALELPYSRQNSNFKSTVTRLGRDVIIIGLLVCLLRTGYISQWMANNMTQVKEVKVQRSWISGWFTRPPQEDQNSLYQRLKNRLPLISKSLPAFGYVLELCNWTVRIFKSYAQNSIGWLESIEDNLPDVGVSLLTIGGFLFLMGSTLTLRDNWVLSNSLAITNCVQCLADARKSKMADPGEEMTVKRDVELAVPIFKFVKVFPYHKRFSGTKDFSLDSVKMKLIIQFNRATQTP